MKICLFYKFVLWIVYLEYYRGSYVFLKCMVILKFDMWNSLVKKEWIFVCKYFVLGGCLGLFGWINYEFYYCGGCVLIIVCVYE